MRNDVSLLFAEHGREWGTWKATGPTLTGGIGEDRSSAVVLKITHVGTPRSTVTWQNNKGQSGMWSALTAPGSYDLALDQGARWTLPPISITEQKGPFAFTHKIADFFKPLEAPPSSDIVSVPDGGHTLSLLALGLTSLAFVRRKRS